MTRVKDKSLNLNHPQTKKGKINKPIQIFILVLLGIIFPDHLEGIFESIATPNQHTFVSA
jgi:hypothetical protein